MTPPNINETIFKIIPTRVGTSDHQGPQDGNCLACNTEAKQNESPGSFDLLPNHLGFGQKKGSIRPPLLQVPQVFRNTWISP